MNSGSFAASLRMAMNAPPGPAGMRQLVRRRRITSIVCAALVLDCVIALAFTPYDGSENASATFGGLGIIGIAICLIVSVQYSVRIHRLRKTSPEGDSGAPIPVVAASSSTYAKAQQLNAVHRLMEESLSQIENQEPEIRQVAERSWRSLERSAHRIQLLERTLNGPPRRSVDCSYDAGSANELLCMIARFTTGADRYIALSTQAATVADSMDLLQGNSGDVRFAIDRLAGLAAGLREVEQINHPS